jgi:crotonobetainyl-CoA:carnitine CoA-transferase CaiB-like acyl-CoA transferase
MSGGTGPLEGLKVVEFAHVIAGPLAGALLADLGATVVHVEDPGSGDPQRAAGPAKNGTHVWWKVAARNKRSVTLNLRSENGREIARKLAAWADVVITNFRVETLEKWGLDFKSLQKINSTIVYLQVTGFGANSSRRNDPGFGKVGEAMSGVVNITGFADGPPVHTGFSHGDSVTGLMGAFAIQAALYRRSHDPKFQGEWIDLALYEPLFRIIEWQVVVYDQLGIVPMRSGNKLAAAPAAVINMYQTSDHHWLTVTSGTPRSVSNVAALVGEPAEKYLTRAGQAENSQVLDSLLSEWIAKRPIAECIQAMKEVQVVASPIFTVEDMFTDPTYRERENIITVEDPELGKVRMQNVVPRFVNYPGSVWRSAPKLGEDNDLVYGEWLGITASELDSLRASSDL